MPGKNRQLPITSVVAVLLLLVTAITLPRAMAKETPDLNRKKIVVPDSIAGVMTISAEEVISDLLSDDPPLLIDARLRNDRRHGYIENSISLPDIETNCESLQHIIASKKQRIIFYCNGIQCGRSVVSIKVARSCGYHELSWFRGGFAEWKEKGFQYVTEADK